MGPTVQNRIRTSFRFLLRAVPLAPGAGKPDVMLWPKDLEVYVNSKYVANIKQRKQQSHDKTLWKGMCHSIDLTDGMFFDSYNTVIVTSQDAERFAFQLAMVEVTSKDAVFADFSTRVVAHQLPLVSATARAINYVNSQLVSIDEDEGEDAGEPTVQTAFLSLRDPISRQPIQTPVRGAKCAHVQCFDLKCVTSEMLAKGRKEGRWRWSGVRERLRHNRFAPPPLTPPPPPPPPQQQNKG
jgi:hypothetical protein